VSPAHADAAMRNKLKKRMQHRFDVADRFKPEISRVIAVIPVTDQKNHARRNLAVESKPHDTIASIALTQKLAIAVVVHILAGQSISRQTSNTLNDTAWIAAQARIEQEETDVIAPLQFLAIDLPKQMVLDAAGFGYGQAIRYGHADGKR
jgi:hypothetical protein